MHQKRISGPLLDRIDIHIEVPRVDNEKLSSDGLDLLNKDSDANRRLAMISIDNAVELIIKTYLGVLATSSSAGFLGI